MCVWGGGEGSARTRAVCVCECVRVRVGVWMWVWVFFGDANWCIPLTMLVGVCQCCTLIAFKTLSLL